MRLVISECKGLNGQLEGECGENGEGEEVSKHQVAILVATEDVVGGGDQPGYPVAGCLTHLGDFFKKKSYIYLSYLFLYGPILPHIVGFLTKCRPLRVNTCREWLALSWPVKMTWP